MSKDAMWLREHFIHISASGTRQFFSPIKFHHAFRAHYGIAIAFKTKNRGKRRSHTRNQEDKELISQAYQEQKKK